MACLVPITEVRSFAGLSPPSTRDAGIETVDGHVSVRVLTYGQCELGEAGRVQMHRTIRGRVCGPTYGPAQDRLLERRSNRRDCHRGARACASNRR
jgi:hypothetical protein